MGERLLFRFVVGAVALLLSLAALAKSIWPASTATLLAAQYGWWLPLTLVELELLLAAWLASGFWPSVALRVALLTFVAFAAFSLWQALSGQADCGCFGAVLRISPWFSLAIDLTVIGLLSLVADTAPGNAGARPARRLGLRVGALGLAFVVSSAACTAAAAANRPVSLLDGQQVVADGEAVALNPDDWVGQKFPLLSHIDVARSLEHDQWTVILYRHDCAECRELISRIDGALASGKVLARPLALLQVPPHGFASMFSGTGAIVLRGRLRPGPLWHVATPAAMVLKDGQVVSVIAPRDIAPGDVVEGITAEEAHDDP